MFGLCVTRRVAAIESANDRSVPAVQGRLTEAEVAWMVSTLKWQLETLEL